MMLLIKISLLFSLLLPDSGKWQRIQTPECISFLFPNTPEKIVNTNNGIRSTIYQTKDLTCVFGIVCSDMSSKKIRITSEYAQILYEELKKGSLSIETAILKEEKTIPYENMIIKEIQYSIYKDKYEMTYIKRFIFRDNYIYQISIGGLYPPYVCHSKRNGNILQFYILPRSYRKDKRSSELVLFVTFSYIRSSYLQHDEKRI